MSNEAALLAAILAHPDEDTPRLISADWLDENGQPERAEFIRIQCAPDADEAAEERAAELEERNRARWLVGLPQFPGVQWEFRRGFPEYLDAPGDLFLEHYAAFARVRWLRFLSLHRLNNSTVRDLVNREWNPQWVELELMEDAMEPLALDGYDNTPAIVAIARCPQMRQLRVLRLSLFGLTQSGVVELASSPFLNGLGRLALDADRNWPKYALLRERFGDRLLLD